MAALKEATHPEIPQFNPSLLSPGLHLGDSIEPNSRPTGGSTSEGHGSVEWQETLADYSNIDQDSVPALRYLCYGGIKEGQSFRFVTGREMFRCTKENLVCLPPLSNYESDSFVEDYGQTRVSGRGAENAAALATSIIGTNVAIKASTSNNTIHQNRHDWHQDESHKRIPRAVIRVKITPKDFSQEFQERLTALKTAPDKRAAWRELVEDFGTHYVKEVVLGSSIKKRTKNRNDNNEGTQGKDRNISTGFLLDRNAGGPAARIGIGHKTSSITRTKQNENHSEIRGGKDGEANASEGRPRYWTFIDYKQTAPVSALLSDNDRRDLGLSKLSGTKSTCSYSPLQRNGVFFKSNKGWLKPSRNNNDFELVRPIFSTPSLYWLGDMVNHSESCGIYEYGKLLSPIHTFVIEWASDDKKEYILKPVAKDNANYDTIGFCYYHCEEELNSENVSRIVEQNPLNLLRGVRRDFLEKVEWIPEPAADVAFQNQDLTIQFVRTAPSKFRKMDLYKIQGRDGNNYEAEPNGLLMVSKHRSRRSRAMAHAPQPLFRIKKGFLDLEA